MKFAISAIVLGLSATTAVAGPVSNGLQMNGLQLNGVVSNVITINAASPRDHAAHQALVGMAASKLGG